MKKTPPPFRLGKRPPRLDARTLQLAKYLRQGTALPPAPPSIDWTAKISSWPMMANDTLGDCTCAAAGHMIECWTANLGDAFTPTNSQIIAAYSATGDYVVGDPATDNGAVELDVRLAFPGRFLPEHPVCCESRIKTEDGHQRKKEDWPIGGHDQRGARNSSHAPEVDFAPQAMCLAALRGHKRQRSQHKRSATCGNVKRKKDVHPPRIAHMSPPPTRHF